MTNVDRLSLFSRASSNIGAGLPSMGLTEKINFDLYPDNAATMIDEGLVFKVSVDEMQAVFPGFPFSGYGIKIILFAPRVAGILLGFSFLCGGSFFKRQGAYQPQGGSFTSAAGFFDLSALGGISLPVLAGQTVPGVGFGLVYFVPQIKFNYNGSVTISLTNYSTPSNYQGNEVMFEWAVTALQGSFYVERASGVFQSGTPPGIPVPVDQIDTRFKYTLPDSWFV